MYFAENRQSLKADDFETIKQLGEGNFTTVFKVEHKLFPGLYMAMKVCQLQKVQNMRREADILMEKHALTKIRDSSTPPLAAVRLVTTFKDSHNLYFLTEVLNHKFELWEHCRSFGMISPDLAKFTLKQICKSVKTIHDLGIIHRDLKPENMFLSPDLQRVILIDFGSSDDLFNPEIRKAAEPKDPRRSMHRNFVGTAQYMAPECVRNKDQITKASDVWSIGCILY
jgi:3-phosphoinositide dependent protein kinase-1